MNKRTIQVLIFFLALLCVGIYAWSEFNRTPMTADSKEADIKISAEKLIGAFQENSIENSKLYSSKLTEIQGNVTDLNPQDTIVILNNEIRCRLNHALPTTLELNMPVKVKGFFGGYDDLMEELLFIRCVI